MPRHGDCGPSFNISKRWQQDLVYSKIMPSPHLNSSGLFICLQHLTSPSNIIANTSLHLTIHHQSSTSRLHHSLRFCFTTKLKMSNPTFVHIDMSNPPTSYAGGVEKPLNYFTWFCKQLEEMQQDSDLAVLTIVVPAKRLVDSGEADLSSWPQLLQQYAAIPQDCPSSAVNMTPIFLRAAADLIDNIHQAQRSGQHTSTQAQPQQSQDSSGIKQESKADPFAQISFGSAPGYHGNSFAAAYSRVNPAVPASGTFQAAQGPPNHPHSDPFGLLTPDHTQTSPHTPQPQLFTFTPTTDPEDSKEQAEKPVNSATSLDSYQTGLLTPTGPPHHREPFSQTPSATQPNYSPSLRPGQLPHHRPNAAAKSFSKLNPFPFDKPPQTPASSMAGRPRSQSAMSSASPQNPSYHAATMRSQGGGNSARRSVPTKGRREMGARGRPEWNQPTTQPTGAANNSNSGGNNNLMDMDFDEPTHNGQGFH